MIFPHCTYWHLKGEEYKCYKSQYSNIQNTSFASFALFNATMLPFPFSLCWISSVHKQGCGVVICAEQSNASTSVCKESTSAFRRLSTDSSSNCVETSDRPLARHKTVGRKIKNRNVTVNSPVWDVTALSS